MQDLRSRHTTTPLIPTRRSANRRREKSEAQGRSRPRRLWPATAGWASVSVSKGRRSREIASIAPVDREHAVRDAHNGSPECAEPDRAGGPTYQCADHDTSKSDASEDGTYSPRLERRAGPPRERIDFAEQAEQVAALLRPGDHLVGHSYGGVISLLAASQRPDTPRSLTVNEPPAFGVARGDPAVEDFLNRFPQAPREPRAYLDFFLPLVGSNMPLPDPLPPDLEAGARAALGERPPHEAEIPLSELAATRFPKLVVSGGHSAVFDAVCDALERELDRKSVV